MFLMSTCSMSAARRPVRAGMGGRVWAVEDVDVDEAESVWPFAVAVIVSSSGLMRSSCWWVTAMESCK